MPSLATPPALSEHRAERPRRRPVGAGRHAAPGHGDGDQRLSPKLRAVVFLHFYEDLTLARIATELGIPESTAKTRLYEALRRLQRFLPAYTGSKSGERT